MPLYSSLQCHHSLFPFGLGLGKGILQFAILLEKSRISCTCRCGHPLLEFSQFGLYLGYPFLTLLYPLLQLTLCLGLLFAGCIVGSTTSNNLFIGIL